MLRIESKIIIFLSFITFISSTLIFTSSSQNQFQNSKRYLQINPSTTKIIQQELSKIIEYANAFRNDNKLSALSLNSNAGRILNQWQTIMKTFMSLHQYFQLYGIMNVYFEVYSSIPDNYVSKVIQKLSQGIIDGAYNQYAFYYKELDVGNKQVNLIFLGGSQAKNNKISDDQIKRVISEISNQVETGVVLSQNINVTQLQLNITVQTTPPSGNTQTQTPPPVQSQPVINPQLSSNSSSQSKAPTSNRLTVDTQTNSSLTVNSQVQLTTTLNSSSTISQLKQSSIQANYGSFNPQQSYQAVVKATTTPSPQSNLSMPVIQANFCNTTYYPNIILSHCLPKSFLKDQIFTFRGKITIINPTGMSVNVIYTRISDQQRLTFSQYLRPNITEFQIQAELNMTGNYYLSVFVGKSGIAAANTFTISPSFIGSIVSRAPSAIKSASLNLISNDLWLNWTYSDISQPALTQIIFTQDGGKKKEFLISNYETELRIPFSNFYDFYSGTTDIQITQAFSSNQSAISRTSYFSAPYNIIFTATTHHYDINKNNNFDPIPLKVNQKDSITISGTSSTDLQNEIVVQTPDKRFVSVFINGKNESQKIKSGTKLNISIQFNTTGVHILEVNDAGGQAIINVPIYVGDIMPLIPDFIDLNPKYFDLVALNQPTLLDSRRQIVLMLLNDVRKSFGQSTLYLDNKLNDLAQNYSATQIQYNFVGHYDAMGRGPGQRAEAAGILEGVGQNIAVNNNLTNAQLMLQRSPIHLRNMVSPLWTRVGLGIVQNPNQMYYLTQQFSSRDLALNPLTYSQLSSIQNQILNFITNKYPNITGQDKGLSSRLSAYQNLANRPYIISYLNGLGYNNFGVANVKASFDNGNYMDLITTGSNFEPTSPSFKLVGISVIYSQGNLEIFAAYI